MLQCFLFSFKKKSIFFFLLICRMLFSVENGVLKEFKLYTLSNWQTLYYKIQGHKSLLVENCSLKILNNIGCLVYERCENFIMSLRILIVRCSLFCFALFVMPLSQCWLLVIAWISTCSFLDNSFRNGLPLLAFLLGWEYLHSCLFGLESGLPVSSLIPQPQLQTISQDVNYLFKRWF